MCEAATILAGASLALGAGTTVMNASQQQAEADQRYAEALSNKQQADLASSAKLRADRDALNAKANQEREKAIRDNLTIQRTNIKDVGRATAAAAASGVSGAGMGEIVTALYRSKNEATDVAMLNADTAQGNINAELTSKQTSHNYTLASNTPTRGAGVSGLAMAIDIGKSGIDAVGTYKDLSGRYPWESKEAKP